MRLLLDTHVVLWWQRDDRRLGRAAREAIASADLVWVSAVSGWEIAISELPHHHTDPFDRLLVAQALVEDATVVSHDRALEPYGVETIWT